MQSCGHGKRSCIIGRTRFYNDGKKKAMKLLLPVRISLICIALTSPILAQKPTPTPERDRRIVALINDARLAAPELKVDTLLKLVETNKVIDAVWRKEIIDEALRMIDDVQYSMPMHAGIRPDRDGTIRSLNDYYSRTRKAVIIRNRLKIRTLA